MKVKELIDRLQSITVPCGGDVNDLDVNVVIGKASEATLHPILPNGRGVFRDDAPFCNLNCVFIFPDLDTQIKRPPLFGQ